MANRGVALVLVDWENIWISLKRDYRLPCTPQEVLEKVIGFARRDGHAVETVLFYSEHFREERKLREAIRACGARGERIGSDQPRAEKNLADTYLVTEALLRFFTRTPKPERVIVVSGDNGYTALLRAFEEQGVEIQVCGLKKSMASIITRTPFGNRVKFLDGLFIPAEAEAPSVTPKATQEGFSIPTSPVENSPEAQTARGRLQLGTRRTRQVRIGPLTSGS